jgi:hypothetical protein
MLYDLKYIKTALDPENVGGIIRQKTFTKSKSRASLFIIIWENC